MGTTSVFPFRPFALLGWTASTVAVHWAGGALGQAHLSHEARAPFVMAASPFAYGLMAARFVLLDASSLGTPPSVRRGRWPWWPGNHRRGPPARAALGRGKVAADGVELKLGPLVRALEDGPGGDHQARKGGGGGASSVPSSMAVLDLRPKVGCGMDRDQFLQRLANLNRAPARGRPGQRAPHKPRLLLLLFGRYLAAGAGPVSYGEAEEPSVSGQRGRDRCLVPPQTSG